MPRYATLCDATSSLTPFSTHGKQNRSDCLKQSGESHEADHTRTHHAKHLSMLGRGVALERLDRARASGGAGRRGNDDTGARALASRGGPSRGRGLGLGGFATVLGDASKVGSGESAAGVGGGVDDTCEEGRGRRRRGRRGGRVGIGHAGQEWGGGRCGG